MKSITIKVLMALFFTIHVSSIQAATLELHPPVTILFENTTGNPLPKLINIGFPMFSAMFLVGGLVDYWKSENIDSSVEKQNILNQLDALNTIKERAEIDALTHVSKETREKLDNALKEKDENEIKRHKAQAKKDLSSSLIGCDSWKDFLSQRAKKALAMSSILSSAYAAFLWWNKS